MVSTVMLTDSTRKHLCRVEGLYDQNNTNPLLPYCARFLKMFQAPVKIAGNGLAAGCQLFYRKSSDIFCSAVCLNFIVISIKN